MKIALIVLLSLAALATARPDSIFDLDTDDFQHDQSIDDDRVITGSYSWISPEGTQFFVRYIADHNGFRVLESNAVPVNEQGVRADGQQGSFKSSEESEESVESEEFDD